MEVVPRGPRPQFGRLQVKGFSNLPEPIEGHRGITAGAAGFGHVFRPGSQTAWIPAPRIGESGGALRTAGKWGFTSAAYAGFVGGCLSLINNFEKLRTGEKTAREIWDHALRRAAIDGASGAIGGVIVGAILGSLGVRDPTTAAALTIGTAYVANLFLNNTLRKEEMDAEENGHP